MPCEVSGKKQRQPWYTTRKEADHENFKLHHHSEALRGTAATDEQHSLSSGIRTRRKTRAPCSWKSGLPSRCSFSEPSPERKALSANSLQYKSAKEWEKGSILCISMFSKGLTPELVSPETVRHHHLLKRPYRTQWKVLASAATFPRHSSGQIRNFFSKNLSAKNSGHGVYRKYFISHYYYTDYA